MPTANVARRRDEGDDLVQLLLGPRDEQHHEHAGERQEGADAQQPVLVGDGFHGLRCP